MISAKDTLRPGSSLRPDYGHPVTPVMGDFCHTFHCCIVFNLARCIVVSIPAQNKRPDPDAWNCRLGDHVVIAKLPLIPKRLTLDILQRDPFFPRSKGYFHLRIINSSSSRLPLFVVSYRFHRETSLHSVPPLLCNKYRNQRQQPCLILLHHPKRLSETRTCHHR